MSEKKHVVYWGKGKARMYCAFLAEEPARTMYEGLKRTDPTAELKEQTDAEAAASGAWSLEALMAGQGSVGMRDK